MGLTGGGGGGGRGEESTWHTGKQVLERPERTPRREGSCRKKCKKVIEKKKNKVTRTTKDEVYKKNMNIEYIIYNI